MEDWEARLTELEGRLREWNVRYAEEMAAVCKERGLRGFLKRPRPRGTALRGGGSPAQGRDRDPVPLRRPRGRDLRSVRDLAASRSGDDPRASRLLRERVRALLEHDRASARARARSRRRKGVPACARRPRDRRPARGDRPDRRSARPPAPRRRGGRDRVEAAPGRSRKGREQGDGRRREEACAST